METINFEDFVKKHKFKNDTMSETELQRVYKYNIYPRDPKLCSDNGFVNIDNGSMPGPQRTCFYTEDNNSYYFDSFRVQPDKVLLNQLPKPTIYHDYRIQAINSKFFGPYCSYFFYLVERINFYKAV